MIMLMRAGAIDGIEQRRSFRDRGASSVANADARLLRQLSEGWHLEDSGWQSPRRVHVPALLALLFDDRHAMAGFVIGIAALVVALALSSVLGVALPTAN